MGCKDLDGRLRDVIAERTGLCFDEDTCSVLWERAGERMRVLGLDEPEDYVRMLSDRGRYDGELKELMKLVTVKETYFFRNEPQMKGLVRRILPDLLKSRFETRRIRVWSAGCSTGEEPYTLAMLLREHMKEIGEWDVEIWGTDIDEEALEVARRGIYGKRSVQKVPKALLGRHFRAIGGGYELCPEIREMVRFRYQNMVEESLASLCSGAGMDLILCRNVLIYFREDTAGRILEKLWRCLGEGGYLLLGHSEGLYGRQLNLESTYAERAFFYQKQENIPTSGASPRVHTPARQTGARASSRRTPSEMRSRGVERAHPERRRSEYASGGVPSPDEPVSVRMREGSAQKEDLKEVESYIDGGRLEEASERIRSVLALDPLSVQAHFLMALLARAEGRTEEAVESFRRVVYLDPSHLLGRFHLANAYRETGQKDQALRAYRTLKGMLVQRKPGEEIEGSDGLTVGGLLHICEGALVSMEAAIRNPQSEIT